jgi:hypothetical protein
MARQPTVKTRQASIGINKTTGAMQLTVPQGTKLADALKALHTVDLSKLGKIPRGCAPCLSGVPFTIREDFDPVINVELGGG